MAVVAAKASNLYTNEPLLMPVIEALSERVGSVNRTIPPEVVKLCAAYAIPRRPVALHAFVMQYFPDLREKTEGAIAERTDPLRLLSVNCTVRYVGDLRAGRISKLVFYRLLKDGPLAFDMGVQAVFEGDANAVFSMIQGRAFQRMLQPQALPLFGVNDFGQALEKGHVEICNMLVGRLTFPQLKEQLWVCIDNLAMEYCAQRKKTDAIAVSHMRVCLNKAMALLSSRDVKKWLRDKCLQLLQQFSIRWRAEKQVNALFEGVLFGALPLRCNVVFTLQMNR